MKIIDCFPFFNETDTLELRLNYLNDEVDYFIISESNITFTGKPKTYNFEKHSGRFKKFFNKIIYIKHKPDTTGLDFSVKHDHYTEISPQREVEKSQRNSILKELYNFDKNDIFLLCDVDEIWNIDLANEFKEYPKHDFLCRLEMKFHYFYFNCLGIGNKNSRWTKAFFGKISRLEEFNDLHFIRNRLVLPIIKDAGWHFSYLSSPNSILKKIGSFAHTAFDIPRFKNLKNIENSMMDAKDPFNREGHDWSFVSLSNYPYKLRKHFSKYSKYIKKLESDSINN